MICKFQEKECKFKKFNEYHELFFCELRDKYGECPYDPGIRTVFMPLKNKQKTNKDQKTLI